MSVGLSLDPLPIATSRVVFDVTRLLRNRNRRFGTGVDRIDLVIGLDLARRFGSDCRFALDTPLGPALLPAAVGAALLDGLAARWRGMTAPRSPGAIELAGSALRGLSAARGDDFADATYVNASHSGLPARQGALGRLGRRRALARVIYLHDLIPLEYPEYQRPASTTRFRRFLDEALSAPAVVIANSQDTARRVAALAARQDWPVRAIETRHPRVEVSRAAAAGVVRPEVAALAAGDRPYFLVLGTIEPRKNHLLLLHIWRDLAARNTAPLLVVAGRRGWENEMVLDMLDRCPALVAAVREFGDLSDAETTMLLRHARALLMPSFVEGLGVPLLEADALGARVVASDIPAFREIAPPGALLLDPTDGPAWRRAIEALSAS